jgi:peptidoglycan-N-acetylglucosamine deacetylase
MTRRQRRQPWQPLTESRSASAKRSGWGQVGQYFRASLTLAAAILVVAFFALGGVEGLLQHRAAGEEQLPPQTVDTNDKTQVLPQQRLVPDGRPVVALTFDDGPNDTITPALIAALNERGVKATFFMLGEKITEYPEVAQLAFESGHQIESHTYDHKGPLTTMDEAERKAEVNETIRVIREIIGKDPQFLRPPFGIINYQTALTIGWPMILWTVDPRDWECQDADQVYNQVMDNIYDGAVVLMHDKYPSTLEAAERVVDTLQREGWRFVTIEEYYQLYGIETLPGHVYRGTMEVKLQ